MFSTLYIGFNSRRILHEWKMERKTTSFPIAENRRGAVTALSTARSRAKWALLWKTELIHRLKMWKMRKTQALRGFSGGKLRGKPWNTFWKNVFQHRGNRFAKTSESGYELGFSVFSPIFQHEFKTCSGLFRKAYKLSCFSVLSPLFSSKSSCFSRFSALVSNHFHRFPHSLNKKWKTRKTWGWWLWKFPPWVERVLKNMTFHL